MARPPTPNASQARSDVLELGRRLERTSLHLHELRSRAKKGPHKRRRRRLRRQAKKLRALLDRAQRLALAGELDHVHQRALRAHLDGVDALLASASLDAPSKKHLKRLRKRLKAWRKAMKLELPASD